MKKKIYKRLLIFIIGIMLLFLSLLNYGEKFVKDTGSIICFDCIGLGK